MRHHLRKILTCNVIHLTALIDSLLGGGGGFTKTMNLSDELAEVVGTDTATRAEVVKKMWSYIKENKLQDPRNKQFIKCDEKMMNVVGVKKFR